VVFKSYQFPNSLITLSSDLSQIDISYFEEPTLVELSRVVRKAQRSLDGLLYKVHAMADELSEKGSMVSGLDLALDTGQVSANQARKESRRSELIRSMPNLENAVIDGQTSSEHIDAINRHLSKLDDDEKSKIAISEITEAATKMPVDTFNRYIKHVVDEVKQDNGLQDYTSKQEASEFKHWFDKESGMGKFCGQLDPLRYEAMTKAIDTYTKVLTNKSNTKSQLTPTLAATSLYELTTSNQSNSRKQTKALVNVIVDLNTLNSGFHKDTVAETSMGIDLPPETVTRLCCDATLQKVVLDNSSVPINVGRKYRTATDSQWAATKAIHDSCAWINCDRRLSWCQLHHITEWVKGGSTDLSNLIPLCNKHHHRVHEGEWSIKLKPDRSLEIFRPNKTHWKTTEPPSRKLKKWRASKHYRYKHILNKAA